MGYGLLSAGYHQIKVNLLNRELRHFKVFFCLHIGFIAIVRANIDDVII